VLHLGADTAPDWARRAAPRMDAILLDHAHLEKKAASTAMTLMFRYPEHPQLMRPLSELAREELEHFEAVLAILEGRNLVFGRSKPSAYPGRLLSVVREGEPERLVDTLLCCAFIEARSCERMKLLAEGLFDAELAEFYRALLASEARHHRLYLDLAASVVGQEAMRARMAEVAAHEAEVIRSAVDTPHLHGG
jgi:tRNA 2-(methylsulfanyl)-N6-isopentenyladenosine37 hydroxylase